MRTRPRLLPIFPAQPSAAYFFAQLPQLGSFYRRQAVSTTAFIQVCLGDPVADRLFVGFKLSGQLTGAAPGSMKLDYLLGETRVDKLVLFLASCPPFSQRIRCPTKPGNSTSNLHCPLGIGSCRWTLSDEWKGDTYENRAR